MLNMSGRSVLWCALFIIIIALNIMYSYHSTHITSVLNEFILQLFTTMVKGKNNRKTIPLLFLIASEVAHYTVLMAYGSAIRYVQSS